MNSISSKNGAPPKSRLILGGVIFISGFLSPLAIPLVTGLDLSAEWKTALSGMLLLGVPEVFMLIAITILGKQGFDYLKFFLWKAIRPADKVSVRRYRVGLVLFFSPLIFGLLQPYLALWITGFEEQELRLAILGDILFASSLFMLGGGFWLKVRALFTHDND